MKRRFPFTAGGIATIEMAVVSTMLFTLLLGSFALVFVLHKIMAVQAAVDKFAYDGTVKAVRLSSGTSGLQLAVDDSAIRTWLDSALRGLEQELRVELDTPQDTYWIEGSYAVLGFEPGNGQSLGVMELPYREHFTLGQLSISSALDRKTHPGQEYSRLAEQQQGAGPQAVFALPTGLFGDQGAALRFQDKLVAVHIRAFVSFAEGLTGRIYSWLGGDPVAWSAKAIVLRREL